jgi:CxxC motif-containing protein
MASMVKEIICIQCPVACRVKVTVDDTGNITEITGYQCKVGKAYAEQECKSPQRVLTATVKTEGSTRRLLPVRTNKPVPKDMLRDCMCVLAEMKVKPPLAIGDIILQNISDTGTDVVCTDYLPK